MKPSLLIEAQALIAKLPKGGKDRTMDITEVTEEMIDRVMPPEDDGYTSCPLCDYTGHWNCAMGTREDQRRRVRELLEQALGLTPNAGSELTERR